MNVYRLVIQPRNNARMAKALTHIIAHPLFDSIELLRGVIVIGCALSLIFAGQALPSGL